jgi:hypothetical protein
MEALYLILKSFPNSTDIEELLDSETNIPSMSLLRYVALRVEGTRSWLGLTTARSLSDVSPILAIDT